MALKQEQLNKVNEMLDILPIRKAFNNVLEQNYYKFKLQQQANYWIWSLFLTKNILHYNNLVNELSQEILEKLISELSGVLSSITEDGFQLYRIKKCIEKMGIDTDIERYECWKKWPTILTSIYLLLKTRHIACYAIPKLFLNYKDMFLKGLSRLFTSEERFSAWGNLSYLCYSFLEFIDELIDVPEDYCKEYEFYNGIRDLVYDAELFKILGSCKDFMEKYDYPYALYEVIRFKISSRIDTSYIQEVINNTVNNISKVIDELVRENLTKIDNKSTNIMVKFLYDVSWLLFDIVRLYDKVINLNMYYGTNINEEQIKSVLVNKTMFIVENLRILTSKYNCQSYLDSELLRRSDIVARLLSPLLVSLSFISGFMPLSLLLNLFYTDSIVEVLNERLEISHIFPRIKVSLQRYNEEIHVDEEDDIRKILVKYFTKEYKCRSEVVLQQNKGHAPTEVADLYINLSEHCENKMPIELYFIIKRYCRDFSMHQIMKAITFKDITPNFRLIILTCSEGSIRTDLIPEIDKHNKVLIKEGIKILILGPSELSKIAVVLGSSN